MPTDYTMYGLDGVNRDRKLHNIAQALASARISGNRQREAELERRLELRCRRLEHDGSPASDLTPYAGN